jgi:YD repeat-containing protein
LAQRTMLSTQKSLALLLFIFILLLLPFPSAHAGNTVQYIYDDLGRLSKAADENGNYAVYEYDGVGNLISISRGITSTNPPTLQSISPDVLFTGATTNAVITGQNLLTTREVASENPSLSIKILATTDTEVNIEITTSSAALPGNTNISVRTAYGSANMGISLLNLSFSPSQLALTPGSSGNITATIAPVLGRELSVTINNSNAAVASIPQSVTIPSNGTTTFSVAALAEGVSILNPVGSKTVFATIFVTQAFTTEPGETVTSNAAPVSVYIEQPASVEGTTATVPVSVSISQPVDVSATTATLPVSVYIQQPTAVDAIIPAVPVSVYIEPSSAVDAITVSLPVSTQINSP